MGKKINTKDLIDKIEKVARERIAGSDVVSLGEFRKLKKTESPPTVLLIDDDETIRVAVQRIFEADGFKVIAAADGTQLSSVLDDSAIDIILLDVGLPWINGYELAEMMKESHDLKDIPLVFISARRSETDVRRGFEVGAADYIKKPFEVDQIRKTVHTLLKLSN